MVDFGVVVVVDSVDNDDDSSIPESCVPWVVDWRSAVYEGVLEVVVVVVGVDVTVGGVVVVDADVTAGVVVDADVTAGVVVDADVTAGVVVVVDVVDDDEDEDEVVAAAEESSLVVSGSVRLSVSAASRVSEVELTGSELLVQSD